MVATRQKRRAAIISNALLDTRVLENVLSHVGCGHALFVTPVSKRWNEVYNTLGRRRVAIHHEGHTHIITCDPKTTLYSAALASASRIQLAHESGLDCTSLNCQLAAAKYADVATLATAHKLGLQFTAPMMGAATYDNRLAVVQYLHSQGCAWYHEQLELAARKGYLELLRWCYEQGCPFEHDHLAPHHAADSGSVELMAWVLQQDIELSEGVMSRAAGQGHTALCQYLHAQQCPWDAEATSDAAAGGHVTLLRWLVDNGCPCDPESLRMSALESDSAEVLACLQQQGFLSDAATLRSMLADAVAFRCEAAAEWLREQGAQ